MVKAETAPFLGAVTRNCPTWSDDGWAERKLKMEKMQNTNTLVELLKKNGFKESESPLKDIYFNHRYLTYSVERNSSVYWCGPVLSELKVEVLVNLDSNICRVDYYKSSRRAYKSRCYANTGKRTYNAIAATVKNAGFQLREG